MEWAFFSLQGMNFFSCLAVRLVGVRLLFACWRSCLGRVRRGGAAFVSSFGAVDFVRWAGLCAWGMAASRAVFFCGW
uniref:Uncharacterized protein n=1 Tax=Ixodes ricinus TaxID=34613 RepID=A0A6B0TW95_IXORI